MKNIVALTWKQTIQQLINVNEADSIVQKKWYAANINSIVNELGVFSVISNKLPTKI